MEICAFDIDESWLSEEAERMSMHDRKTSVYPIILTDGNFDMKVGESALILVDFWADWCMPCQMMAPVFERLAEKYAGKITFAKLNVDENMKTARRFNVFSIPTLILFDNGRIVDKIVGYTDEESLDRRLKAYLK